MKVAVTDTENQVDPSGLYYRHEATDFTVIQDYESTDMSLSWVNPKDKDFSRVVILRKAGAYPSGIGDSSASIVYSGSSNSCVDLNVAPHFIYFSFIKTEDSNRTREWPISIKYATT